MPLLFWTVVVLLVVAAYVGGRVYERRKFRNLAAHLTQPGSNPVLVEGFRNSNDHVALGSTTEALKGNYGGNP